MEVPFVLTPEGHILIQAKVNGVQGNFIFDTGAGINLFTQKFANTVGNLERTHHFYTGHRATGEALQGDLWNYQSLKIGDFDAGSGQSVVYDFDFPIDGLIALAPFKDQPFTIDFENKALYLESPKSLEERYREKDFEMPIAITNDRDITIDISTAILVNDTLQLHVGLDSGAGFGVYRFNSRYMEDLGVDSTQVKKEFKPSYFDPEKGNMYYYVELEKLSNTGKNTSTQHFDAIFIDGLIYEGIMGLDWIGQKITIDLPNQRLIVKK
ncbi:MAG: retropepsin-like aspartic protease [Allomuricauda sp.]